MHWWIQGGAKDALPGPILFQCHAFRGNGQTNSLVPSHLENPGSAPDMCFKCWLIVALPEVAALSY